MSWLEGGAPRVFCLPPGVDFSAELARGLRARLAGRPAEEMARLRLYLNTRRTGRAVQAALEDGAAAYLPRIAHVGELQEAALRAGLPGWSSKLRRTLALMRLTEAFLARNPRFGDAASAPALAVSLRGLLDELQAAGADPDDLRRLDLESHAEHWELTAEFLEIIAEAWPAYLEQEEGGALDPEARRREAVAALAAEWAAAPPGGPVIAAGSTGSTPATAELLRAVARLPQGAVVLPGWDRDMPPDVWEALRKGERPEHPHHHLAVFLESLGLGPRDPVPWTDAAPEPGRLRLLTQALRPAPVTDAWRAALPELSAEAGAATQGLTLLEAASPREEAQAIAAALVRAAHDGRRAALVTPDKVLARRVTAALARWGVIPDDSAGRPLGLTPPGVLLGLVAGRLGRPMTAETLAAILRHPLVGGRDEARGLHLRHALRLERDGLRGGPQEIDWDRLERRLREARRSPDAEADAAFFAWLGWARSVLAPLADGARDAAGAAALQRAAAEALSAGQGGEAPTLWEERAGADALAFMEEVEAAAPAHGGALAPGTWGALWTALIQAEESRRDPQQVHDRILILGALEARAETAEVMVLGGLNEGVWPAHPAPDPWLSRDMRARLRLASPERRIGLAAHDFLQAACAGEAILSRASRDDGGPTVPSRWRVRLENLLKGADPGALEAARARGAALLRGADRLDVIDPLDPAERPAPTPPVEARPRRLSVTRVEALVRDPYAIYAQYVLGLRRLEPLGRAPGALDMGNALHAVMEAFGHEVRGWKAEKATPEALRAALMEAADRVLPDAAPWPALRRLWRHRLARAADWLAEGEAARLAGGRIAALETPGERVLEGLPGGPFRLTAKADRVDALEDGRVAIYDWKSGAPPTDKEIGVFALQLLLEGVIAEAGGFEGVAAGRVGRLEYLGLTGSGEGGKAQAADLDTHPLEQVAARLAELIAAYDAPDRPYRARLRPKFIKYPGDYDQLARHGEWSDGGDAE